MVLESLISTKAIRKNPYKIFFPSVLGTFVAVFITKFLSQNGLFLVFLIGLVILPSTISNLKIEEKKKEYDHFWDYMYNLNFIRRHSYIITYYLTAIFGVALAVSFCYLILPQDWSRSIFSNQIATINMITGNFNSFNKVFSSILINNISVATVLFIISLFYSTGAIFLISWNASVLGVAVAQGVVDFCSKHALPYLFGIPFIPVILLSYLPHGIFEFLGFTFAGIAGGILSLSITRHRESKRHRLFILKDALSLYFFGIIFIIIGAIIESYLIIL